MYVGLGGIIWHRTEDGGDEKWMTGNDLDAFEEERGGH